MSIRTVVLRGFGVGGSISEVVERGFLASSAGIPVANFSANSLFGSAPFAVQFTDLSTNTPTSWLWTFGDGGTSTQQNPVYVYSAPGTYTVSLMATNAGGSGSLTKPNYIVVIAVTEPRIIYARWSVDGHQYQWSVDYHSYRWSVDVHNYPWSFPVSITSNFAWHLSEDLLLTFTAKSLIAGGIAGWTIAATFYSAPGRTVISPPSPVAGTVTDPTNCIFTVPLPSAQNLEVGQKVEWIQVRRIDSGFNTVLAEGPVTVSP